MTATQRIASEPKTVRDMKTGDKFKGIGAELVQRSRKPRWADIMDDGEDGS